MSYEVQTLDYTFVGPTAPPATASPDGTGPWRKSTTGAVTVAAANDFMALTMDATNEVQNGALHFGENLSLDVDDLISVDIWAKISASLGASVRAVFGLAGTRNADPDAIAQSAWFGLTGSNTVFCETDDGTTDSGPISTGLSLAATERRFQIDFKSGHAQGPVTATGGKTNIIFRMENSQGLLQRVCPNTVFTLGAYSSGLQFLAQIQKTSGTATGTLSIKRIRIKRQVSS